jgi:hypothetical protein
LVSQDIKMLNGKNSGFYLIYNIYGWLVLLSGQGW